MSALLSHRLPPLRGALPVLLLGALLALGWARPLVAAGPCIPSAVTSATLEIAGDNYYDAYLNGVALPTGQCTAKNCYGTYRVIAIPAGTISLPPTDNILAVMVSDAPAGQGSGFSYRLTINYTGCPAQTLTSDGFCTKSLYAGLWGGAFPAGPGGWNSNGAFSDAAWQGTWSGHKDLCGAPCGATPNTAWDSADLLYPWMWGAQDFSSNLFGSGGEGYYFRQTFRAGDPSYCPFPPPPTPGGPTNTYTRTSTRSPTRTVTPSVATFTSTVTPSATPTRTATRTATPSSSITPSSTVTPTATPSRTVTQSPTVTPTSTHTVTPSATPTRTPTPTPSATPTVTPSPTATPSATPTFSVTPTFTRTVTPSPTPTRTDSPSPTSTFTQTATRTPSPTPSSTSTGTLTLTQTVTASVTPSATLTATATPSSTITDTNTPGPTATYTVTPSPTSTVTITPSVTPSATESSTATPTPTQSVTPTGTASITQTGTPTGSPTITDTNTPGPTATYTVTPSPTSTVTASPSVTVTVSPSATETPTYTQTATRSASPSPSETPSATPSPTATPSATPTSTDSPIASPTPSPSVTPTSSGTPTSTPSPSATPSPTETPSTSASPTGTPSSTISPTPPAPASPTVSPTISPTATPSSPVSVRMRIFNSAGELIFDFPTAIALFQAPSGIKAGSSGFLPDQGEEAAFELSGTHFTAYWNGTNNGGQTVSNGVYHVTFTIQDSFGAVSTYHQSIEVIRVVTQTLVQVYNSAGELVWQASSGSAGAPGYLNLSDTEFSPEAGKGMVIQYGDGSGDQVTWDGRGMDGKQVASGVYQVKVTKQEQGKGGTTISQSVSVLRAPGGALLAGLSAGPNPATFASSRLIVTLPGLPTGGSAEAWAYNLAGERICALGPFGNTLVWDLKAKPLAPGIYLIRVEAKDGSGNFEAVMLKVALLR